jgi:hypothetical protein
MNSRALVVLCLAATVAVSGCRMADGPMPTPTGDVTNRLDDLRRDLGDVVAGHAQARKDFADDLLVFVDLEEKPEAVAAVNELARQLTEVAAGTMLKESASPPLLRQVWTAVAARELSEKQVTQLQADVKTTLTGLGVAEPSAQAIANQIGTVQKAVTDRQRRWYEVF